MIENHILQEFSGWDVTDEYRQLYYDVVLKDEYKHLNTFKSEIDLYIDYDNSLIEIIQQNSENESKVYEIDVLTFKEKV